MANSKRQCRNCKSRFITESGRVVGTAFYCSEDCQVSYGMKNRAIGRNKLHAEKKRKFKANDKPLRMREAVKAFNRYIRLRDAKEPCISCQRHHSGQYHAGHYKPAGINSALRFDESNVWKQCAPCNNNLSGNLTNYRINLISKIGIEAVEALDTNNEIKRYTCEELKQIELTYKDKIKQLEQRQAA